MGVMNFQSRIIAQLPAWGSHLIKHMLLLLLCWSGVAVAEQKINNVRVWKAPDSMRVVFDLSGPIEHSLFMLENPTRLVVDFKDTARTKSLFNIDLKAGAINNVRSAKRNGNDLRVVLDLKQSAQTKSFLLKPNEQYGHRLVVDLELSSGVEPQPVKTVQVEGNGRDIVIAIDAGHGGEDPGATGSRGTLEKDVVLAIAKELQTILAAEKGFKPVLVRSGDYFLKLKTRRDIAREKFKADLFVSIHADAFTDKRARGASVFALSRKGATSTLARVLAETENQSDAIGGVTLEDKDDVLASVIADLAMEGSMEHSLKVGKIVLSEMGRVAKLHKRQIEQAGFAVLKSPDIPSILVETGFISNPDEESKLSSKVYRAQMARAIRQGITRYFEQHPPPGTYLALRQHQNLVFHQHKISNGETLSEIAQKYQVSLGQIRQVNELKDRDVIRVGQVLRIPRT